MNLIAQILQDIELKGWSFCPEVINSEELGIKSRLFDQEFTPAKVGKGLETQRLEAIRGDLTRWIDPANPPLELTFELDFLEKLKLELNRQLFLGLKDLECHLARYPKGSFYRRHSDLSQSGSTRVLTFIFYLHADWQQNDGGELVIYDRELKPIDSLLPRPGALVCFLSADFPHEVKVSMRERWSFTGWFHQRILT